jgi:hypothetical protein
MQQLKLVPNTQFTHKERILLIVTWPITLIFFIYSFIKTFFLNKNESNRGNNA